MNREVVDLSCEVRASCFVKVMLQGVGIYISDQVGAAFVVASGHPVQEDLNEYFQEGACMKLIIWSKVWIIIIIMSAISLFIWHRSNINRSIVFNGWLPLPMEFLLRLWRFKTRSGLDGLPAGSVSIT